MTFTCTECHAEHQVGRPQGQPVLRMIVERGWRHVKGRWQAELVNLLDPGEQLCSVCAQTRRNAGIAGADERREQGKTSGSGGAE